MKYFRAWVRRLLVVLFGVIPAMVKAQAPPIRIMPLGDSITFGMSIKGGYRNRLYHLLSEAGYNIDFVGTRSENGVDTLPDLDHQGHIGWRIDQIDTNLLEWFGAIADPDVILLHIGVNDFGHLFHPATAIDRLDGLITKIATHRPHAHIVVTNLLNTGVGAIEEMVQTQFNPFVEARVNAQAALGRRVTFLNMRAAVPLAELEDGLHPNQIGYDHMADKWFSAVESVITPAGDRHPPAISHVKGSENHTAVAITFSKPVADSAADPARYAISGDLTVLGATLDAAKRVVTLTTSMQTRSRTYIVTVNGVTDLLTPIPNVLPANSTANFVGAGSPPVFAGYAITTRQNAPTVIAREALLAKVTSLDNLPSTIIAASGASAAGGPIALDETEVKYTPPKDFLGVDAFTVTMSDQFGGTVTGTVAVSVTSLAPVGAGQAAVGFRTDGKLDVVFAGIAAQSYRLQRNIDLTNEAGWTTIQTVVAGDDGAIPFTDLNPPADRAFYRVLPPE